MRPISDDTRIILSVHNSELTFDLPAKVEARPVFTVYNRNGGQHLVHCAHPELAYIVTKFIRQHKYEIGYGAPISHNGLMLQSSATKTMLADADLDIITTLVPSDDAIARNVIEAIYVLGYTIIN